MPTAADAIEAAAKRSILARGQGALSRSGTSWTQLEAELDPSPFLRREWGEAILRHFGGRAEPWILCASEPAPALLSLRLCRAWCVRQLVSLAHGPSDYAQILAAAQEEGDVQSLIEPLRGAARGVDLVWLRGIPEVEPLRAALGDALGGKSIVRTYEVCPRVSCVGSWEEYLAARSKKFRANLKRSSRRVHGFGSVVVNRESPSASLFDELIDVERESWKWSSGRSTLRDPTLRGFLRDVVFSSSLGAEIWTLRVDGVLAAFALTFASERARYYYLPSFRMRFPESGTFLLGEIVRDTFESERDVFDFLQGDERYKLVWATDVVPVYELVLGRSVRGRVALLAFSARWQAARSPQLHRAREWIRKRTSSVRTLLTPPGP